MIRIPKHVLAYLVRALCVWTILASAVSELRAQDNSAPSSEEQRSFITHMGQILDMALSHRVKASTEPGVPGGRVQLNGQWEIHMFRLTPDTGFGIYKFGHKYAFYVQANLCELDGSPIVPDGTLLGADESAAAFYEDNYYFFVKDRAEFKRCADQAGMRFEADPLSKNGMTMYRSSDRVLRQMCNWLRFLAKDESDPSRAVEFMAFILHKHRQVLLDADSTGDMGFLANEIGFFDRTFPFEVFDTSLPSNKEVRNQARDFFQTTLLLRRKLNTRSPKEAQQITRDEELLHRFTK